MNRKGYVLIEVLVASVLLSLAGTGLYTGLMEGVRAGKVIRESIKTYDPLRVFWKRLEKDLRNSIYLQTEHYTGKQDQMTFPVAVIKHKNDQKYFELRKIRYFIEEGVLKRSDQELSNRFVKEKATEKMALQDFDQISFQYAYLNSAKELFFNSFWLEEPYFGIPKAVKVNVKIHGVLFSKLIAIPQGRWGHMLEEEKSLHEK